MARYLQFSDEDIEQRFTHHPPQHGQVERYAFLRAEARNFAQNMVIEAPACRELALALTKLEEAVMWCNAAIARHGE